MLINLKVKTLDAQTHEFSIDNEMTIREFKDKIAEKTHIAADQQRIIYCGRVLADEKQLKEYDVDGKVVHVAERPPPSQRGPSTSASSTNTNRPTTRERPANRGGMRSSPLFRALDGMVVGTMAIPMNPVPNNGQPINPFAASSSFCMNRITVARHMLECANNIAAYLEDPERGLNNTSLDILARGSWTMESTVVEVGITATDLPQNQNIVEMVQDAVTAALRRNSNATNVTVLQLPTVFGGESGTNEITHNTADNMETNAGVNVESAHDEEPQIDAQIDGQIDAPPEAAIVTPAVIIEDVIEIGDDGVGANLSGNSESSNGETISSRNVTRDSSSSDNTNNSTSTGTNTDENPARRRTSTNVLAEVIEQMRAVQTRLDPFIQQYYELLRNDPAFEENNTTERENTQRLYNRVSEAFHYMSHAQHAISDLMLDVSQPTPRYLTCRPILVEQSGYVNSNNYLSGGAATSTAGNQQRPRTRTYITPRYSPITITTTPPTAASASVSTSTTGRNTAANNSGNVIETESGSGGIGSSANINANNIDDAVYDAFIAPDTPTGESASSAATQSNDSPQMQMSRLIQAMVNSAPIDTELHVQILPPTILSVPVNAGQVQNPTNSRNTNSESQQRPSATVTSSNANSSNNSSTEGATTSPNANTPVTLSGSNNQARVNTATLPTTSTQTRSTSRPQLQIGGLPANGWNGRFIPANMMSSFDRFLPCNSHHIRETENSGNNNSGGSNTNNANTNTPNPPTINTNPVNSRTMLTLAHLMQQRTRPTIATTTVGSTSSSTTRSTSQTRPSAPTPPPPEFDFARSLFGENSTDTYRRNLRNQLASFMNQRVFEGAPINEETIPTAVNRAVNWFGESLVFLSHYEKEGYNSRDSIFNILRRTLPKLIDLLRDNQDSPTSFEWRLKVMFEELVKRIYSVLHVCVGSRNAELYWVQLMRLLMIPTQSNFRDEALHFLSIYVNIEIPPTLDTADAQQFIVKRNKEKKTTTTETYVTPPSMYHPQPMESDIEMIDIPSTSEVSATLNSIQADIDEDVTSMEQAPEEPLPNVVPNTETWHRHFSNDWLPIISRDMSNQSANPPSQSPFSDAYISGMSAKRRKMIQHNKPPTEINSLVEQSVRKAIQTVGARASTSTNQLHTPDDIAEAIASDPTVNSAITEAVRTNVRERLKKDPDYKPEKYPHTTKFINK